MWLSGSVTFKECMSHLLNKKEPDKSALSTYEISSYFLIIFLPFTMYHTALRQIRPPVRPGSISAHVTTVYGINSKRLGLPSDFIPEMPLASYSISKSRPYLMGLEQFMIQAVHLQRHRLQIINTTKRIVFNSRCILRIGISRIINELQSGTVGKCIIVGYETCRKVSPPAKTAQPSGALTVLPNDVQPLQVCFLWLFP